MLRHTKTARHHGVAIAAGAALFVIAAVAVPSSLPPVLAAKTLVVVGGAGDPTSEAQWRRIGADYAGAPPILVRHPAQISAGFPGFTIGGDGRTTYDQTVDIGADATARAIDDARRASNGDGVVVYALSQGTDVAAAGLLRYARTHPATIDGPANLTVVLQGGPSFIRTGAWNVIPPGIPGVSTGLIRTAGAAGARVVAVCIAGDGVCAAGNPFATAFYALPGLVIHGTAYNSRYIGRFSSPGGEPFTPGSVGEAPVSTTTVVRGGREVVEAVYADGAVKRTWFEDNVTWVGIDTGENPWMWMVRAAGVPVPTVFDRVLNALVPVPQAGESTPGAGNTRPSNPPTNATDDQSGSVAPVSPPHPVERAPAAADTTAGGVDGPAGKSIPVKASDPEPETTPPPTAAQSESVRQAEPSVGDVPETAGTAPTRSDRAEPVEPAPTAESVGSAAPGGGDVA
ncbi:PE-PPE domain-containing protein OS=Tsukamurella paurometabola (strain ATCC 8368 / DSM / CCUG 35730 / CIP 100753 / JCM 10117 / KCTC 9821 / NBRC 16120 /NCIMB 702349 / NCTC 13040) OX=521096 GN=Tpau_2212 PE=4 SV=1 [Tsukamurella paurometabola]|nr:PE-PPE domain [Tsukamurella paurometabola]